MLMRTVEGEIVVNAGIDDVWKAWTTKEGVKSFFAPDCNIELKIGGAYEMLFDLEAEQGSRGGEGMKFLAIQSNKLLSFTWNAPPHIPDVRKQLTHVTVLFEKISQKQTKISLAHDGWGEGPDWDEAFKYFEIAWLKIVLPRLKYRFDVSPIDWNNIPKL